MSSNHHRWQSRWQIDEAGDIATHEMGLQVRLVDGAGVAINGDEMVLSLVPVHGAHNAPAMVQRLVREGTQMLVDPYSRGWRS